MARIRTIKPEFPQSESIGRLSRDARLLFVQLWTVVDDHGRARAAQRLLAGQLYPYDDDAPTLIGEWLDELERGGFIRLYQTEDSQYLDIPQWSKHQRIDNAGKSNIPEFSGDSPRTAASVGEPPLYLGPRTIGKGPRKVSCAVASATRTERDEDFEEFWKVYPKRQGANPKAPALKGFKAAIRAGIDPKAIIGGARRCGVADIKKVGTEFIPQAVKWLRDRRWDDYPETTGPPASQPQFQPPPGQQSLEEIRAKYGKNNAEGCGTEVRSDPRVGQNGTDHGAKLSASGRVSMRDEERGEEGRAPDD